MLAYAVLERGQLVETARPDRKGRPSYAWVQGWTFRVLVSFSEAYPVGYVSGCEVLASTRHHAKQCGVELGLPSIGQVQACIASAAPYFFSRGACKALDGKCGASRLRVARHADGRIVVTNGRSVWAWTGDNLRTIINNDR